MNVSILICSFGDSGWHDLAWSRASPSAVNQGALEVLVEHDEDATLAGIRNEAAGMAAGDFLCFLDADDELAPGYIAAMPGGLDGTWSVPGAHLLAPALSLDGSIPVIPNRGGWPRVNECTIGTLIPRHLFLELGGFREQSDDGTALTMYEDWDLFLRACDAGARIVHVPDAVYRAHSASGGRNSGAEWRPVYDAIWADHERRVAVMA